MAEIKHKMSGEVLASGEGTVKEVVEQAVKEGADLVGADLRGADLRGADLRQADLRGADLRGADLTGTCFDPEATCLAYTCAVCGVVAITAEPVHSLDEGTPLTCDKCGGKTVVKLVPVTGEPDATKGGDDA